MKTLLDQYAAYEVWANRRLLDFAQTIPQEQQSRELPSSFKSLQHTFFHMWEAQTIWWNRLQKLPAYEHGDALDFSMHTIAENLIQQSVLWDQFVHASTGEALQGSITYYNSRKGNFEQPLWQILLHIFNHGTYHRGQVITIFHSLDAANIPATDFIVFTRGK